MTAIATAPVPPLHALPDRASSPAIAPVPQIDVAQLRRFTVDEYHQLIQQGFFAGDDRFELLEGLIVRKMPHDPIHDACVATLRRLIDALLPPGFHVRVQSAVTSSDSEPEPDIALVRGCEFDYAAQHPGARDTPLLAEVANTSVAEDRVIKGPMYARAGFPIYWLLNIPDRRVEIYTDPSGPDPAPAYRRREDFHTDQAITLALHGAMLGLIQVADLFPAPAPAQV